MVKLALKNILLRALTLASKFILILFLARHLTLQDLGVFGIMNVTIAIALLVLGLDFYVYNTRQIVSVSDQAKVACVRDQLFFHLVVYLVMLPLAYGLFLGGVLERKYLFWFYLLLVLEHLGQEAYRFLIALCRPLAANFILFLRSGAWVYGLFGWAAMTGHHIALASVWASWSVSCVAALGVTAIFLRRLPWRTLSLQPDWNWIKRGLRVAFPFFLASFGFVGMQYVDRYFLQHYRGQEAVGIYTFFCGIANVVQAFVYTGSAMIHFPKVVAAYQQGQLDEYRQHLKRLGIATVASLLVLLPACSLAIKPVLQLVGKPLFATHLGTFWLLLFAAAIMALSNIPHYALYARHQDKKIVTSTMAGFAASIFLNAVLVPRLGLAGSAISALCSSFVMAFMKARYAALAKDEVIAIAESASAQPKEKPYEYAAHRR